MGKNVPNWNIIVTQNNPHIRNKTSAIEKNDPVHKIPLSKYPQCLDHWPMTIDEKYASLGLAIPK
jgi:hypothetical protein